MVVLQNGKKNEIIRLKNGKTFKNQFSEISKKAKTINKSYS